MSVVVHLINIPAHSGIYGNDTADKSAREVAYKISIGIISAPNVISVSDAYSLSAEIACTSWQRKWSEDSTGRYTYQLIPSVGSKVVFPKERDVGISFCRLLLHDTMLNDDSFRCGTSVSPACDCGSDRETAEHFLFYCSKYAEARRVMFDNIKEIWFTSKLKGQCKITESLLLADPRDVHGSRVLVLVSRPIKTTF